MSIELAERVAEEVGHVRGVARMAGGGMVGLPTTVGAGRQVDGVRIRATHIDVHIVAAGSVRSLPAVADAVRNVVMRLDPGRRVDVFVEDVDLDLVDLVDLDGTDQSDAGAGAGPLGERS